MSDQAIKTQLRRMLSERRAQISTASRAAKNHAILQQLLSLPELQGACRIFCFISSGTEVDTRILINHLLAEGKQLAVPRLAGKDMLAVDFPGWSGLGVGPYGIPEPLTAGQPRTEFDLCITPGLGFTANGLRLGYGLGYYDRWFAENHSGVRLAPAYECQLLSELPTDDNDIAVNMLVTEERMIRV